MTRYAFFQNSIVPLSEAKIGIMTHGFLYGTACFEGIRGYWCPDDSQMYVFRMKEHFERMLNSCKILKINPGFSLDELCDIATKVVFQCGDKQDVYIRPIFYKSSEYVGVKLDGLDDDFMLFAVPFGAYLDLSKGLKVRVSSWRHIEDNMIPMRAKINGAYVNAALAKSEALVDGYDESIFLDSSGHVSEGSAENLFLVRNGKLITPTTTSDILEGITRATVLELARDYLGIETVERQVDRTELYVVDEAFFVGTGAQVSPITEIDRRTVGTGKMGPVCAAIQEAYFAVVKNKLPQFSDWCTPVY